MKRRIGDRRGRARFEIVGTLTGTVETLRRLPIRNVSSGGALLDTRVPFAPGSRISGRISLHGVGREVRGEVRHITTLVARDESRYLVGVEWDESTGVADLLRMQPIGPAPAAAREGGDRRAAVRFDAGADAEFNQPNWCTVELIDVSTTGVLFLSPSRFDVGERGELRVRLGEASFMAQIETRRVEPRKSPSMGYRVGAAFVSLSEASRLHLEDFIGDARR